jgi:acyl-CoA thioesterase FadM
VAEAKTVLVAFDYERNESRPLPEAWRKLLSE